VDAVKSDDPGKCRPVVVQFHFVMFRQIARGLSDENPGKFAIDEGFRNISRKVAADSKSAAASALKVKLTRAGAQRSRQ